MNAQSTRRFVWGPAIVLAVSLTACNGGGDDGEPLPWRNPSDFRASCASLMPTRRRCPIRR